MANFPTGFMFRAIMSDDYSLVGPDAAAPEAVSEADLVAHLNANPRHAAVLVGSEDGVYGSVTYDQPLYVLRGAGEDRDNFYYGNWPAEDPNDAVGGDLDAATAVLQATVEYYR